MNKSHGLTVGAILVAGLIARSVSTHQTEIQSPRRVGTALAKSAVPYQVDTVGPWIASCNYWSSVRPSPEIPYSPKSALARVASVKGKEVGTGKRSDIVEIHRQEHGGELTPERGRIGSELIVDQEEEELGCLNSTEAKWGFPIAASDVSVTTIVATVPDPVHTHAGMSFDRIIAALLQAAQDNGYLSSYYWVPWKQHGTNENDPQDEAGAGDPGHDPKRERQPGLVVLKNKDDFNKVIYLFLVGESPTEGVNGFQLQNAFQYESDLRGLLKKLKGSFSTGRNGHISIIGPNYTGSATSLMAGIKFEAENRDHHNSTDVFDVSGSTSTKIAAETLSACEPRILFHSFDPDGEYTQKLVVDKLTRSGYDISRIAVLVETSTTRAVAVTQESKSPPSDCRDLLSGAPVQGSGAKAPSSVFRAQSSGAIPTPLFIPFPREISLLRNAQEERVSERRNAIGEEAPSPFLHLSLKDSNPTDSIPLFSRENTPLSQEAQLMAIGRELHRFRVQYIAIVASNPLDSMFLAQFLRRACPDARLLFTSGDLLMEREIDNVPFIGTTTVTSYPLVSVLDTSTFPDSQSEADYNAANFAFWDLDPNGVFPLKGYSSVTLRDDESKGTDSSLSAHPRQPFLWATAVGSDGYYPLGMLSPCASSSDQKHIAPAVSPTGDASAPFCSDKGAGFKFPSKTRTVYPSLLWDVVSLSIIGLCFVHSLMLRVANFWSPMTRDLAIAQNAQPRRRVMYINAAATVLFSMACVVALPALAIALTVTVSAGALVLASTTLGFGVVAVAVSLRKVAKFSGRATTTVNKLPRTGWIERLHDAISNNICFCINLIAWATGLGIPGLWLYLCLQGQADASSHTGVFFSYRCINPGSGVSPVAPVFLLLLGWYVWAFFQTRRLRLSDSEHPRLPLASEASVDNRFFVSDESLCGAPGNIRHGLMRYASCLFITRESLRQALVNAPLRARYAIDLLLLLVYLVGLIRISVFDPIRGLNHLFWEHNYIADPFEILMGLLFFPLVVVALAGWLRTILMWAALRNGLLERLENQPIRLAFSRLKGFGWVEMFRQSGFHEQLRDMARSVESIRYVLHEEDIKATLSKEEWKELDQANASLVEIIDDLRDKLAVKAKDGPEDFKLVHRAEQTFAWIGSLLLKTLLVPYWQKQRTGLVDGGEVEELPMKARRWEIEGEIPNFPIKLRATPESADPSGVIAAQEFIALRYVALMRAVLANVRSLLVFISVAFVLCIIAWHSYPFQPRQQVDWLCTGLFFVLGTGIVWVFAQMYRNPLLSRITDTHPNELGWEFYLRILAYGAIPVLTWLAYQFPDIGNQVFKLFQPAAEVMK